MNTTNTSKKAATLLIGLILAGLPTHTNAQSGACVTQRYTGSTYINTTVAAGCDVTLDDASGSIRVGPTGVWTIYGALNINQGLLVVEAGGVLNVYGNVNHVNNMAVLPGAIVNYYGESWTNGLTAAVWDNGTASNPDGIPGGNINFIAPRPAISASFLTAQSALSSYNSGSFAQVLIGANVPMDIALHIQNSNNVNLSTSPTRIEGSLVFDVDDGHVRADGVNLIFTTNGIVTGYNENRYVVTDGPGHVTKENFTNNFIFPVGFAESDYTPASINNTISNTFSVSVSDYATSNSVEVGANGINRTWNIYATSATGNATINLQHNISTNQANFITLSNFVTRWSALVNNNTGDNLFSGTGWQSNTLGAGTLTGSLTVGTPIVNASERSRVYTDFATGPTDPISFYSKSSDILNPLPVTFINVSAGYGTDNSPIIKWRVGTELDVSHYNIERSATGSSFDVAGTIKASGLSDYSFKDQGLTGRQSRLFYRVRSVDIDGSINISKTVRLDAELVRGIELFPQPFRSQLFLRISSDKTQDIDFVLFDASGRELQRKKIVVNNGSSIYTMDNLEKLMPGIYNLRIQYADGRTDSRKLIKQ